MDYIEYKKHITDLYTKLSSQLNCALPEAIRKIRHLISNFYKSKSSLSDTLEETLVQVRSGIEPVSALYNLAQQYRRGNFSLKSFQETEAEFEVALRKIEFCNRIQMENSQIEFFGLEESLISRISENSHKTIYILFTKTEFRKSNLVRFVENLNTFMKGLNGTTKEISQFIVDCDFDFNQPFCSNLTDTTIHEYRNGKLTATDFKQTVLETENNVQVEINNLKNVTARLVQMLEDQNEIKRKCSEDTCFNGGSCTETETGTQCNCQLGYHGTKCENLPDHCENSPCQNNGACRSGVHSFTCTCSQGFKGETCEVSVDECGSKISPCLNGGECIEEVGGYACVCPLPWAGHMCQHKLNPCKVNECKNEATCSPSSNYLQYICSCDPGYNGTFCEFDFKRCTRNTSLCLNGGTCHSTNGSYTCDCAPGFDGPNCARNIDDCAGSDLCRNGGTCIDGINHFSCICADGFQGGNCSTLEPDAYYNCSALARSSRTAMTVVNADCGGVVPIPNFPTAPSLFLFEYNPNMTRLRKEQCLWTLDQTKDGTFHSIRIKVTLLCGDLVDSEGALTVLNVVSWNFETKKLAQKDEYYESKSSLNDWKLFLSYNPSNRHKSRFLALITVLATSAQTYAGSSFVFNQPSGTQTYGPFTNTDIFSLVVVHPSQINATFTVDSFQNANPTNKTCSFGNGDVFDLYEIPTASPPNRLDRFCYSLPSARSYSSKYPFVILTIPHTQKA